MSCSKELSSIGSRYRRRVASFVSSVSSCPNICPIRTRKHVTHHRISSLVPRLPDGASSLAFAADGDHHANDLPLPKRLPNMKIFASLLLLPCAAFAFTPLHHSAKKGATVVQSAITSKWTMMPEGDPAPEVSFPSSVPRGGP